MSRAPRNPPASLAGEMPPALAGELRALDRRVLPRDLEDLVVRLCSWSPLPLREIARLLGRDDVYLQNTVIKRLLEEGRLGFLHRGQPNHPRQAYVAGPGRRGRRAAVKPARVAAPKPSPRAAPPRVPAVRPLMEMPDIGRND